MDISSSQIKSLKAYYQNKDISILVHSTRFRAMLSQRFCVEITLENDFANGVTKGLYIFFVNKLIIKQIISNDCAAGWLKET